MHVFCSLFNKYNIIILQVRCSNNVESYGRKKREADTTQPHKRTTATSSFIAKTSSNESTRASATANIQSLYTKQADNHYKPTPSSNFATISPFNDAASSHNFGLHSHNNIPFTQSGTKSSNNTTFSPRSEPSSFNTERNRVAANVTEVYGVFMIVSSTPSPFSESVQPIPLRKEYNWWAAYASKEGRGNNYRDSDLNISYVRPYQQNSVNIPYTDTANRRAYHTADGVDNIRQPSFMVSILPHRRNNASDIKMRPRDTVENSSSKISKSNTLVTPPRYRPGFTDRPAPNFVNNLNRSHPSKNSATYNISRPDIIQKDTQRKFNKISNNYSSQRRTHNNNRYYAYNTNAPRQRVSNMPHRWSSSHIPDEVQSSLTTPELVISTTGPVPDELPLSLAIMVGEDPGVDLPSWKSNTKHITGKLNTRRNELVQC